MFNYDQYDFLSQPAVTKSRKEWRLSLLWFICSRQRIVDKHCSKARNIVLLYFVIIPTGSFCFFRIIGSMCFGQFVLVKCRGFSRKLLLTGIYLGKRKWTWLHWVDSTSHTHLIHAQIRSPDAVVNSLSVQEPLYCLNKCFNLQHVSLVLFVNIRMVHIHCPSTYG